MNKETTYEQELAQNGELIYTTAGRSMRPFLRSGEDMFRLKAKGAERCSKYDAVLYRRDSGVYVLHRIVSVEENSYTLCGDNCCYLEPGIREDQILGILTHVIRKGRMIDVSEPRYCRRIRIWVFFYYPRAAYIYVRGKLVGLWLKIKKRKKIG